MKKYCIYFCLYYNEKYIELLNLSLKSIKLSKCNLEEIDILVITDSAFTEKIYKIGNELELPLRCIFKPFIHTLFASACARLHIFSTYEIKKYEKILYMDTDILVKKDISTLFAINFPFDRICALEEDTIANDNFGALFFEICELEENIKIDWSLGGLNSGILLFHNNSAVIDLFNSIIDDIARWDDEPPICLDQPFISYRIIHENKFERGILNKWAGLFDYYGTPINHQELTLCHFSWPIGNFSSKYKRMQDYFKFLWPFVNRQPFLELSAYP